ncbi:hypothetical protein TEA_019801 [Camellia sinensis var. sinensis]|uniref:Uncharacterized protein n=1 Tax=Camellia sinensis var. sinensis TaxID=542762 RepID=A0A4S4DUK7_CAMSN|nr:hypothetical protein TEA_019801 [Camellia sinensis var. sinensis]
MPSYVKKLVFPKDFFTNLRTIAKQEDEIYQVSSLLQELVSSDGEKQPSNGEVRAVTWKACGDSGALQLLVELPNMKSVVEGMQPLCQQNLRAGTFNFAFLSLARLALLSMETITNAKKQYDLMLESKQLELSRHLKELSQKNDQAINDIRRRFEVGKLEGVNIEKEKADKAVQEMESKCDQKLAECKGESRQNQVLQILSKLLVAMLSKPFLQADKAVQEMESKCDQKLAECKGESRQNQVLQILSKLLVAMLSKPFLQEKYVKADMGSSLPSISLWITWEYEDTSEEPEQAALKKVNNKKLKKLKIKKHW